MPSQLKKLLADGQKLIQQLQTENQKLKTDMGLAVKKLEIDQYQAETERLKALAEVKASATSAPAPKPNGTVPPVGATMPSASGFMT